MTMIVMVGVYADGVEMSPFAEHVAEEGVAGDGFRAAVAADVAVQAKDVVACRHHQMQVVADHEDGGAFAALPVADGLVVVAKRHRVDACRWFVQDDEVGAAQHGARQQQALRFAAGKGLQRCVEQVGDVEPRQPQAFCRLRDVAQKAARGHRQVGWRVEFLRHEADFQAFGAADAAVRRAVVAEDEREQRAFAGAVRPDDGEDLVTTNAEIDVV